MSIDFQCEYVPVTAEACWLGGGYAVIDGASGKNSKNMNGFWPVIVTFAFFYQLGFSFLGVLTYVFLLVFSFFIYPKCKSIFKTHYNETVICFATVRFSPTDVRLQMDCAYIVLIYIPPRTVSFKYLPLTLHVILS